MERLGDLKAAKQAVKRAAVGKKLKDAKFLQTRLKQTACDEARARKQQQEEHALVHLNACLMQSFACMQHEEGSDPPASTALTLVKANYSKGTELTAD